MEEIEIAARGLAMKMTANPGSDIDRGRKALEAGAIRFMVEECIQFADVTRVTVRAWAMRDEGEQIPQQLIEQAALAQVLQAKLELSSRWRVAKFLRTRQREEITALGAAVRSFYEGPSEFEIVFEQGAPARPLERAGLSADEWVAAQLAEVKAREAVEQAAYIREREAQFLRDNSGDRKRIDASRPGLYYFGGTFEKLVVPEAFKPATPTAPEPLPRAARGERKIDLGDD